jgi:large conductance mechanosensitive channel
MDMVNTEDAEEELRNDVLELGKDARGFEEEFVEFLKKNQVIGLAVAFIIGTAATALVTALVKDIVMPVVGVILPGGNWQTALLPVGPINFIIIALVVFMLVKYIMKADMSKKA